MDISYGTLEILNKINIVIALAFNSFVDIRKKEISLKTVGVCGLIGLVVRVIVDNRTMAGQAILQSLAMCLIPGIICIFLSYVTREQIGYGDGIIIIMCGLCMRMDTLCSSLMAAITVSGFAGIILLTFFKKGKKYEIPFVPFLLIGYLTAIFSNLLN